MSAAMSIDPLALTRRVTLCNQRGLHARASNKFMKCVMAFDAEVTVTSHNAVSYTHLTLPTTPYV